MSLAFPRMLFEEPHTLFRAAFRRFVEREISPHNARWEAAGIVDRELFLAAGRGGFLAMAVPEEHGGAGVDDFRFNLIIAEELAQAGVNAAGLSLTLHNDIVLPYLLKYTTPEQQRRWLPGVARGEIITAIAMTEPGAGSDLAAIRTTAIRDGDCYVLNGVKTFITNGINADLVVVAAKTDPTQRHRGISLLVVERGTEGFERGRKLAKIGQQAQDTAELYFTDCRVPAANLLGQEGEGFRYLVRNLPQERLSIAMTAVAASAWALEQTLTYAKEREAFGQPIGSFQHNRFVLAELRTELELAQVFVDRCVLALNDGTLTAEQAAMAKWWCTELQKRTLDRCLQLFGGQGYMSENPVARAYLDARVTTIYGGTTEIMKEIIGRAMGV